jgi:hypothetical protein
MKVPVTFMSPLKEPVVAVKKLQAPSTTALPFVGLEREHVVSVGRKFEPSIVT